MNLRPGEYYVAAVDDLNTSQAFYPGILEGLTSSAEAVAVVEGQRGEVEVRVASVRH